MGGHYAIRQYEHTDYMAASWCRFKSRSNQKCLFVYIVAQCIVVCSFGPTRC